MKLLQLASAFALLGAGVHASPWFTPKSEESIIKHDGTPVGEEVKYEGCESMTNC
jgi:hypothetical protein